MELKMARLMEQSSRHTAVIRDMRIKNANVEKTLALTKRDFLTLFNKMRQDSKKSTTQIKHLRNMTKVLKEGKKKELQDRIVVEKKFDEMCEIKFKLEAKLENALEERKALLDRFLKSEVEKEKLARKNSDLQGKCEDSEAALLKLERENQTLQVELQNHVIMQWADDAEVTHCTACGKAFSVAIRKHYCNCGKTFCKDCITKTASASFPKKSV